MSIFDNIVTTEVTNGTIVQDVVVDPSLSGTSTVGTIDPTVPTTDENIRDNRTAADTGKLVHNWWISYMKSLKKFFNDTFDDSIVHFEFNYAAKSMLLKRLYSNIQQQNPSCIINLDSFMNDNNLDPQRRNSGFYNLEQTTPLCKNYTNTTEVFIDFKFVNLQQTIIINFNDSSDVLNYYDRLTTIYPLNINFISYDYRTLINVHNETANWKLTDDVQGIIVDAAELGSDNYAGKNSWEAFLAPQRWAEYYSCPTFMIENITQMVDKQNEKYQLQISLSTNLRVPQTLLVKAMDYIKIKSIQVVMDVANVDTQYTTDQNGNTQVIEPPTYSDGSFKPICIDIDRSIYTDHKIDKVVYLDPLINIIQVKTTIYNDDGIDTGAYYNDGYLILPINFEPVIENHGVALFIIQDSTLTKPRMNWAELGILNLVDNTSILNNDSEAQTAYRVYTKEVWDQIKIDEIYSELDATQRPVGPIEILKIKIPSFSEWSSAFEEIGPWFNIRLLTFNVVDPQENGLV